MSPDCSVIRRPVKGEGQLAQLSSGPSLLFWLPTLAKALGEAATTLVLGRPRKAFRLIREVMRG